MDQNRLYNGMYKLVVLEQNRLFIIRVVIQKILEPVDLEINLTLSHP